jgi:hypothetical protein
LILELCEILDRTTFCLPLGFFFLVFFGVVNESFVGLSMVLKLGFCRVTMLKLRFRMLKTATKHVERYEQAYPLDVMVRLRRFVPRKKRVARRFFNIQAVLRGADQHKIEASSRSFL